MLDYACVLILSASKASILIDLYLSSNFKFIKLDKSLTNLKSPINKYLFILKKLLIYFLQRNYYF